MSKYIFLTSQIIASISTIILLTYTLMKVERKTILVCNIIINSLLALHYLILKGYSGAICSFICVIMVLVFYFKNKNKYMSSVFIPIIFSIIFIISGALTWQSIWSIIPIIGNIFLVIALWNDKANNIKAIFIAVGILWIIYNINLNSVVNIIGQCLAVSFNIIYFIKERQKQQLTK